MTTTLTMEQAIHRYNASPYGRGPTITAPLARSQLASMRDGGDRAKKLAGRITAGTAAYGSGSLLGAPEVMRRESADGATFRLFGERNEWSALCAWVKADHRSVVAEHTRPAPPGVPHPLQTRSSVSFPNPSGRVLLVISVGR